MNGVSVPIRGGRIFCIILSGFGVSAGNCGASVTYKKSGIRSSREEAEPTVGKLFPGGFRGCIGLALGFVSNGVKKR